MFPRFKETVRMGVLELNFLLDGEDTDGTLVQFEMMVPPAARVPAPHFHVEVDETLYILEGTITQLIGTETHVLYAGDHCFIKRGIVHGFITCIPKQQGYWLHSHQPLLALLISARSQKLSMQAVRLICKKYWPL